MSDYKINHYEVNCAVWNYQENPTEDNWQKLLKLYNPFAYISQWKKYEWNFPTFDDFKSEYTIAVINGINKYKISDDNHLDKYIWSCIQNHFNNYIMKKTIKKKIPDGVIIETDALENPDNLFGNYENQHSGIILNSIDKQIVKILLDRPNKNSNLKIIIQYLVNKLKDKYDKITIVESVLRIKKQLTVEEF